MGTRDSSKKKNIITTQNLLDYPYQINSLVNSNDNDYKINSFLSLFPTRNEPIKITTVN